MSNKYKILISVIALLAAYGVGRWTTPAKVVTKTQIVTVEQKQSDANLHKDTVTKTFTKADGTKETITHTVTDAEKKTTDQIDTTQSNISEMTYAEPKVTISALAAINLSNGMFSYGAMLSKPVLGPITVGGGYLSDKTVMVSLGLTF